MQTQSEQPPERNRGRIEMHGNGMGTPTREAVERRARELAQIEGRAPEQVREEDRERASRELHDQTIALSSDEARSDVVATANPSDVAVEIGHRVESVKPADEQHIGEVEFAEGVREAEHERMLEAQEREENI